MLDLFQGSLFSVSSIFSRQSASLASVDPGGTPTPSFLSGSGNGGSFTMEEGFPKELKDGD